MKSEKIITSSFSETGAKSMAKLLTSKYNCTIIDNPKFDKNSGMWTITYHDPKLGNKDEDETRKNEQVFQSVGNNKRAGKSKLGAMENLGKKTKK